MTAVQRQFIQAAGGLDTESPVLAVPPGCAREAWNFEQAVEGGYRRIAGYERFDGSPSPSSVRYVELEASLSVAVSAGDMLTGASSGASGIFLSQGSGIVNLADPTGEFSIGEDILKGVDVVGMVTGYQLTGTDAGVLSMAENLRRSLISPVPGSGAVRGVAYFDGDLYAFRNTESGTAKAMYKATAAGWVQVTTPVLNPGGKLESVSYNFGTGPKLFGCDGVNPAFMFDGTTYTSISTGMAVDTPAHIAAHQNHLFLSFGTSVQHSAIGDPTNWTPVLGAAEINVGAIVTNMVPQPGSQGSGAMAISTPGSLFVLYGTSAADWSLITLQSEVGAVAGSMQNIGVAYMLSDMGITLIGQSQEYGNFSHSVASNRVKSWLKLFGRNLTASTIYHEKNQYRLFFGSRGLFVTVLGRKVVGIMPVAFSDSVSCCTTTSDDMFFWGGDSGYIYRGESGTSFDGVPISSTLVFPFEPSKSTRQRKRYRRLMVELKAESPITMNASFSMSYGDGDVSPFRSDVTPKTGGAAIWDEATWDSAVWDGGSDGIVRVELEGTGENIAISLSHESASDPAFTLQSFILEFSPRRGER